MRYPIRVFVLCCLLYVLPSAAKNRGQNGSFKMRAVHEQTMLPDNVAYQDATVRFTVITGGLIRMEYAPEGKFTDDKSFVAVYPGHEGTAVFYEDNGDDQNYPTEFATTRLTNMKSGLHQKITIGARQGEYDGMPMQRRFRVSLVNQVMPLDVKVNGVEVQPSYEGESFSVNIDVPELNCSVPKEVESTYPDVNVNLSGLKARAYRVAKALEALKYRSSNIVLIDELAEMGVVGEAAMYSPSRQNEIFNRFNNLFSRLPDLLSKQELDKNTMDWFLQKVNWTNYDSSIVNNNEKKYN